MYRQSRPGFTFVELLTVMAVLAILAAIVVPHIRGMREKAYVATLKTQLGEVRLAEEAHFTEQLQYTTYVADLDWTPMTEVAVAITSNDLNAGWRAEATHQKLPGVVCTTYAGAAESVGSADAGEIACGPAGSSSTTVQ